MSIAAHAEDGDESGPHAHGAPGILRLEEPLGGLGEHVVDAEAHLLGAWVDGRVAVGLVHVRERALLPLRPAVRRMSCGQRSYATV